MKRTTLFRHRRHTGGEVSRRIFGSFWEHMGRSIYGGTYDPRSRHADANGRRIDPLRELHMTVARYAQRPLAAISPGATTSARISYDSPWEVCAGSYELVRKRVVSHQVLV